MTCETLLARVVQANQKGLYRQAIRLCSVGLNRNPPRKAERALRKERARAYLAEALWREAERECRVLLRARSESAIHSWLVRSLFEQKRHEAAINAFGAGLAIGPLPDHTWHTHTLSLIAVDRHEDALTAALRTLELSSSSASDSLSAVRLLLQTLARCGKHNDVVAQAQRYLVRYPTDDDLWLALGMSLTALGKEELAIEALQQAVKLAPDRVEACCNLSFALLRRGQLREGFRLNEHRQKNAGRCRRLGVAPWQGEPLADQHLWIWSEQGLGDMLQFARFVPWARRQARETTFMVPSSLKRLLQSNANMGALASQHPGFGAADYQCLVMSLPHHLGTSSEWESTEEPYLFPEPDLVQTWKALLPRGRKIALNWQGNPGYEGDRWRSMPFAEFEPLLANPPTGVHFLSLQKGFGREQLSAAGFEHSVLDLADTIDVQGDAFVDSLAVLSLMNLFMTTDTALAHLAGAAGIRTWLLLGSAPDWRWGHAGDRALWYPSVRIFRRSPDGNWQDVIAQVQTALASEPLHEPITAVS